MSQFYGTILKALPPPGYWLRGFRHADSERVRSTLKFLPALYPQGDTWLLNRLEDVEQGKAYCSLVGTGDTVEGVLIETPKGMRNSKVSTFYIRDRSRGIGLGQCLLDRHAHQWFEKGIDSIHITVPLCREHSIESFLQKNMFIPVANLIDRYGDNRSERIYSRIN